MKSGLVYTGLLLLLIISCIGFVNAAPKGDTYLTVNIGQNDVDVTKYVTGDGIGWCPNSCAVGSGPSSIIGVPDKSSFDITSSVFLFSTGFWYNLDSSGLTSDIALNVVDSYKTVRIGQKHVDVTQYVSGDQIGWWASAADVYQTSPSKTIGITDKSAFDITSNNFVGYDGFWYNLNSEWRAVDLALNVVDPHKKI